MESIIHENASHQLEVVGFLHSRLSDFHLEAVHQLEVLGSLGDEADRHPEREYRAVEWRLEKKHIRGIVVNRPISSKGQRGCRPRIFVSQSEPLFEL